MSLREELARALREFHSDCVPAVYSYPTAQVRRAAEIAAGRVAGAIEVAHPQISKSEAPDDAAALLALIDKAGEGVCDGQVNTAVHAWKFGRCVLCGSSAVLDAVRQYLHGEKTS